MTGTSVFNYKYSENGVSFSVEGEADAQITLELGEEKEYEIEVDGVSAGKMKTNLGGKLTINVETKEDRETRVVVKEA